MANELMGLINEILEEYAEAYQGWEQEKGRTLLFDEQAYRTRVASFQLRVKNWRQQGRKLQQQLDLGGTAVPAPVLTLPPGPLSFKSALAEEEVEVEAPQVMTNPPKKVLTFPTPPPAIPKKVYCCTSCGTVIGKKRFKAQKNLGLKPLCDTCAEE